MCFSYLPGVLSERARPVRRIATVAFNGGGGGGGADSSEAQMRRGRMHELVEATKRSVSCKARRQIIPLAAGGTLQLCALVTDEAPGVHSRGSRQHPSAESCGTYSWGPTRNGP